MKLLLPLKYYDDAGRVKPALALYLFIGFLSRSLMIFIASISMQHYSSEVLSLFYPEKRYLYLNLVVAFVAFLVLLILSFREKIWEVNKGWLFSLVKPLLMFSVLTDFGLHIYVANSNHWQFSWVIAITLLVEVLCFYFFVKDKHLQVMLKDWQTIIRLTSLKN